MGTYPNLTVGRIKQLEDFKRCFDDFVLKVRSPTGKKVDDMDALFDAFLLEMKQYASGFPTNGGIYRSKRSRRV